jgi:cytochrome P450
LRAARDPETGEGFSREQLRDQVATMIVAGHETTSVAIFWMLYLVASSPWVQNAIATEAQEVNLDPTVAADSWSSLVFTRAVVNESMRLYPPAFMIVRHAKGEDHFGTTRIPKNSTVMVAPFVLHRHRRLWQDPDVFDPTRFLPEASPPLRMSYLPFAIGPRVCIGAQFATSLATIMLASLVKAFEIDLADSAPVTPVCVATTHPNYHPRFELRRRTRSVGSTSDSLKTVGIAAHADAHSR